MDTTRGRAAESRAKGVIYGGATGPVTPEHIGKKMVAGAGGAGGGKPFATSDGALAAEQYGHEDFHLLHKARSFADKVGTTDFGSDVYSEQTQMRRAADAQARSRNGGAAPYAADMSGEDANPYTLGFTLPGRELGVGTKPEWQPTDKVGHAAEFDPEVYRGQLAANAELAELTWAKKLGASRSAPFATSDAFDELRRRDYYHAKPKRCDTGAEGKPYSKQTFDPAIYTAQRAENSATQAASALRRFGSGNILAQGGAE